MKHPSAFAEVLGPGLGLDNASMTVIGMPRNLPKEFTACQGRGVLGGVGWGGEGVCGDRKKKQRVNQRTKHKVTPLYNIHSVKQRHATP